MTLEEWLRDESQKNIALLEPSDRATADHIVAQSRKGRYEQWQEELTATAGTGRRECALEYGVIGSDLTPSRRKLLLEFLKEHQLSFEEGTAHYTVASCGEWQVTGYFLVRW